MRKILMVVVISTLVGCAEQRPVEVVSALPSTYQPKALALPGVSRVNEKMVLSKKTPDWMWPTTSRVLQALSAPGNKNGIDIIGQEGSSVVAAADGEVAYSGNALKGYGNLVIIKHKKNFLTAYAHNKKNMVKEGEKVVTGQKIAEMGRTGTDKVKLHFEIRQDGQNIDPRLVLPK